MKCPACGDQLSTIKGPLRIPHYCFNCKQSMPSKSTYDYNQKVYVRKGMTPDQLLIRIGHVRSDTI